MVNYTSSHSFTLPISSIPSPSSPYFNVSTWDAPVDDWMDYDEARPVHFPEEILDMILKAVDDTPDIVEDISIPPYQEVKSTWQACALVCRQWHGIVLPYLFHTIVICDRADDYPAFFASHPTYASLVRQVFICNIEELDVRVLDGIIYHLPQLRRLRLELVEVGDVYDNSPYVNQQLQKDYVLEQLEWYDDNRDMNQDGGLRGRELLRDSVTQVTSLVNVLALFSQIRKLNIWTGEAWKNELAMPGNALALIQSTIALSRYGKLGISELTCGDGFIATNFVPDYFCGIGAARHLTSLKYEFRHSNDVDGFCNLLLAARTLKSLTMHIFPTWYWIHDNDGANELQVQRFVNSIRHGLSACSSLEEFAIELMVDFGGVHEEVDLIEQPEGGKAVLKELPENFACWNLATGIASLVPYHNLRRIRIQLEGSEFSDMHDLRWDSLHMLCRAALGLQSVRIELPQTFDQRGCLAYEMSQFGHAFTQVYIPSGNHLNVTCRHRGCMSYNMDRVAYPRV